MRGVDFAKMAAAGNDFILVDDRGGRARGAIGDFSRFARETCVRKVSIGADGLLVLEDSEKGDIKMRIFNPDGGEVGMCGNGSRCAAYYAFRKGVSGNRLSIETRSGVLKAGVKGETADVEMTPPAGLKVRFALTVGGGPLEVNFINTGVPHIVRFVKNLDDVDVEGLGREIRFHGEFAPDGTNADFVALDGRQDISIRTYERGVEAETLACGTGAVAASLVAAEVYSVKSPVSVMTAGGETLVVRFRKGKDSYEGVSLEGPVKLIYEGRIDYV